jgi:hypothetical protein
MPYNYFCKISIKSCLQLQCDFFGDDSIRKLSKKQRLFLQKYLSIKSWPAVWFFGDSIRICTYDDRITLLKLDLWWPKAFLWLFPFFWGQNPWINSMLWSNYHRSPPTFSMQCSREIESARNLFAHNQALLSSRRDTDAMLWTVFWSPRAYLFGICICSSFRSKR